jgi:hypothetical protein
MVPWSAALGPEVVDRVVPREDVDLVNRLREPDDPAS